MHVDVHGIAVVGERERERGCEIGDGHCGVGEVSALVDGAHVDTEAVGSVGDRAA